MPKRGPKTPSAKPRPSIHTRSQQIVSGDLHLLPGVSSNKRIQEVAEMIADCMPSRESGDSLLINTIALVVVRTLAAYGASQAEPSNAQLTYAFVNLSKTLLEMLAAAGLTPESRTRLSRQIAELNDESAIDVSEFLKIRQ